MCSCRHPWLAATPLILASLCFGNSADAAKLSGKWEVQSMGGDRTMTIEFKGKKFAAHRVMWPEFEGEKYKLEHLYKGVVRGNKIKGRLLVREEEVPKYEVLRPFIGSIDADNRMTIDGLPVRRISDTSTIPAKTSDDGAGNDERGSAIPGVSLAPPAQSASGVATAEGPTADPGVDLFSNIMGSAGMEDSEFFRISSNITGASQSELHHRRGRCHLALDQCAPARSLLKRALRLDPLSKVVQHDYNRSKLGG